MRVITTSGTRPLDFVLRYEQNETISYKAVFIEDLTKAETPVTITDWTVSDMQNNNGQLRVNVTKVYNEGDELTLKITSLDDSIIYHRNKIFVTNQVAQDYNING